MIKKGTVINWIRSTGPGDEKDIVPMYYCGTWKLDCADGMKGDVKARPVRLGKGSYVATYNPHDFETTEGKSIAPDEFN